MTLKNKVEAILFAHGKQIPVEEISRLARAKPAEVKKVLEDLEKEYNERDSGLMIIGGETWKINVREKYIDLVRNIIPETELDRQTMETLAVIAYTQPCVQSDVIKRRNNKAYDHIKTIQDMGFVIKEPFGRSKKLKLTKKFYDYFDVNKEEIEQLFDKFKKQDEKIEEQENELKEAEAEQKKVLEEIKKHEEERNRNPMNMGEQLNNIDGSEGKYEEPEPEPLAWEEEEKKKEEERQKKKEEKEARRSEREAKKEGTEQPKEPEKQENSENNEQEQKQEN